MQQTYHSLAIICTFHICSWKYSQSEQDFLLQAYQYYRQDWGAFNY